jgi:quinol monooxygenase YgiN
MTIQSDNNDSHGADRGGRVTTTPLSEWTTMQKVILVFKCQPGMGAGLLDVFTTSLADTRAFDGCTSVQTFVDADNPDTIMLIEDWESKAQQETYLAWRIDNGMIDLLGPVLAAPLEMRYLEAHPA